MKQLIFNFNLFDIEQKAMIIDTEQNSPAAAYIIDNIDSAGATIAKACSETGIFKIHLFGEPGYLNDLIIPEIKEHLFSMNYAIDNLEIEVN